MNKFYNKISVCLVAVSLSAPAFAASPAAVLEKIEGKILINKGHGFAPAEAQLAVKVGDRILIGAKSSAEIFYSAQSCSVTYTKPRLVVIGKSAPCKAGEKLSMATEIFIEKAAIIPVVPAAPVGGIGLLPLTAGLSQPIAGISAFYYTTFIAPGVPVSLP
jgi:hypothetical protein